MVLLNISVQNLPCLIEVETEIFQPAYAGNRICNLIKISRGKYFQDIFPSTYPLGATDFDMNEAMKN